MSGEEETRLSLSPESKKSRAKAIQKEIRALERDLLSLDPSLAAKTRRGGCCGGSKPRPGTPSSVSSPNDKVVEDEIKAELSAEEMKQGHEYPLNFAMKMMHVLWPNAERAFARKIQYNIVPLLAKDLPPAMQDITVSRIYLGKARPKMGPLRLIPPNYRAQVRASRADRGGSVGSSVHSSPMSKSRGNMEGQHREEVFVRDVETKQGSNLVAGGRGASSIAPSRLSFDSEVERVPFITENSSSSSSASASGEEAVDLKHVPRAKQGSAPRKPESEQPQGAGISSFPFFSCLSRSGTASGSSCFGARGPTASTEGGNIIGEPANNSDELQVQPSEQCRYPSASPHIEDSSSGSTTRFLSACSERASSPPCLKSHFAEQFAEALEEATHEAFVIEGAHRQEINQKSSGTSAEQVDGIILEDKAAPESRCCTPAKQPTAEGEANDAEIEEGREPQKHIVGGLDEVPPSPGRNSARSVRSPDKNLDRSWSAVADLVGKDEVDRLVWEMPFEWRSDMLVEFTALNGMMRFGCEEFYTKGDMQIVMRPILNEVPLYGGISVGFINPPEMDFKFVGTGSGLAQVPMFARKMKQVAVMEFAKRFVLPYSMFLRTVPVDKLDLPSLKFHAVPDFCVRVEVLEMRDLPGSDYHLFSQATSDPYCVFKLGPLTYQTEVVKANLNPVFTERMRRSGEFLVYNARQRLYVEVYDRDVLSADDLLGKNDWVIGDLIGAEPVWVDLQMPPELKSSHKHTRPQIKLKVTKLLPVVMQPPSDDSDFPNSTPISTARGQSLLNLGGVIDPGNTEMGANAKKAMQRFGSTMSTAVTKAMTKSPIPKHLMPRTYLLEIKVYGCNGCKNSSMSAINLRLNIKAKSEKEHEKVFFDTARSLVATMKLPQNPTLQKGSSVPVSSEVVQQLRFAGYSAAKIAHFLGVNLADVDNHLRGAHEELWCKSFFVFVRDPSITRVKLAVLGSKNQFSADPTKYKKYQDEKQSVLPGAKIAVGVVNKLSSVARAGSRVFGSGAEKSRKSKRRSSSAGSSDSLGNVPGASKDALVEESDDEEEEKPEDPNDPAFTEHLDEIRPPNTYELKTLLKRMNYAERLSMKPGIAGPAAGLDVDISFQLRYLQEEDEEEDRLA
ncbi:unnamed protein product [Amoebophrya sp. A120]|nr:unnamed protein product [Amoebophrya sp. A120]|eukprot:GSA120T00011451001.1